MSSLPVYSGLKKRSVRRFSCSLFLALCICFVVYTPVGFFGLSIFQKSCVQSDILRNFCPNDIAVDIGRLFLVVALVTTYPIPHYCGRYDNVCTLNWTHIVGYYSYIINFYHITSVVLLFTHHHCVSHHHLSTHACKITSTHPVICTTDKDIQFSYKVCTRVIMYECTCHYCVIVRMCVIVMWLCLYMRHYQVMVMYMSLSCDCTYMYILLSCDHSVYCVHMSVRQPNPYIV